MTLVKTSICVLANFTRRKKKVKLLLLLEKKWDKINLSQSMLLIALIAFLLSGTA